MPQPGKLDVTAYHQQPISEVQTFAELISIQGTTSIIVQHLEQALDILQPLKAKRISCETKI